MNNINNKSRAAGKRISPKVLLLTVAVTLLLGACGDGGGEGQAADAQASDGLNAKALAVPPGWVGRKPPSEAAKKVAELEAAGVLPKLDTSNSVAGPDVNGNGIRDDIDRYIEQQGYPPALRAAVEQDARVYQAAITTDLSNQAAVEAVKTAGQRSNKCMFQRFKESPISDDGFVDASQIMDRLEKLTLNTKQRLMAWVEFDKKMDGQVFLPVQGEACE